MSERRRRKECVLLFKSELTYFRWLLCVIQLQEIFETITKEIKPNHELRNILDSPIHQKLKRKKTERNALHSFIELMHEREKQRSTMNDPFLCKMHSNIKAMPRMSGSELHLLLFFAFKYIRTENEKADQFLFSIFIPKDFWFYI